MSDPLQQHALGRARELLEACVTLFTFRAPKLHLDEFVIVECATGFGDDCRGDPVLTDQDDGVEGMAESPEILALAFREFHWPDCKDCRRRPCLETIRDVRIKPRINHTRFNPLTLRGPAVLSFTCWRAVFGWCSVAPILHRASSRPRVTL